MLSCLWTDSEVSLFRDGLHLSQKLSVLNPKLSFFPIQVSKLGCKAFALLFDDINPTLKPADAAVYSSSAEAQAMLTNELFDHMKSQQFLFCPTG